ncbi:RNA polymerase sigma factor [Herbiconiux liangxiaofengii]|uniref:RNA polymerase sigma factor n=1 Tax=Herbiconiux liangxiaofengii TaxID=3342795 RepID=UPI0035B97F38
MPTITAPVLGRHPLVGETGRPPVPALDPDSDRMLIVRAAAGDDRAFALIVRRYEGLLRGVARRTLGGSADVDDVVQETFLAAWTHADSVIDGESIAGWLVTTVRRRSYDRLRSTAHRTRADLDDELRAPDHRGPEAAAAKSGLAADVLRVLARMPEAHRRCWELRQLDRLSYTEIGLRLALPATTVRGIIARARAHVRSELEHWR